MKLSHYVSDGSQRIVRLLGKTNILGLECMEAEVYQNTAVALQPAEVCRLPAACVKRLLRINQRLFHTLLAHWYSAIALSAFFFGFQSSKWANLAAYSAANIWGPCSG